MSTGVLLKARSAPLLTALVTVPAAVAAIAGPIVLAVPGGLLLAFVLPGLALNALIFRNRALSAVERTVLAPALSMATVIVAGLGLFVAGVKLDRVTWTLATAGITLFALAMTAVPQRVWHGQEDDRAEPRTELIPVIRDDRPPEQRVGVRTLVVQWLPMLIVLGLAGGAGWLSYRSSYDSYQVTVTTLSAAPPGEVTAAGTRQIEVTAAGLVTSDGPYTLAVTGPDGRRTQELAVPAGRTTCVADLILPAGARARIGLFRAGDTTPYRTLVIAATE